MPENQDSPKELLADQELLGFAPHFSGDGQRVQRASSAKVFGKSLLRDRPEQAAVHPPLVDDD